MKFLILFVVFLSACSTVKIENNIPVLNTKEETPILQQKELNYRGKEMLSQFKDEKLKAEKNSIVFAPEKPSLLRFYKDESSPLIYSKHKLIKISKTESIVQDFMGEEFEVENALLIPLNETVEKGDFVISLYPGGKGLAFAKVLDATDPKKPLVRYTQKILNKKEEILNENTFFKIKNYYDKGTFLVVKDNENYLSELLLCDCNGYVLTLTNNAIVNLRKKHNTTPVQIHYDYKNGDDIFINLNGKYIPATIKSINEDEITVIYKDKSTNKESVVSILEITKNLE